jgi:uncharacterized membrane protein SirB2
VVAEERIKNMTERPDAADALALAAGIVLMALAQWAPWEPRGSNVAFAFGAGLAFVPAIRAMVALRARKRGKPDA